MRYTRYLQACSESTAHVIERLVGLLGPGLQQFSRFLRHVGDVKIDGGEHSSASQHPVVVLLTVV